jgi:short subunit fatty acids transporter
LLNRLAGIATTPRRAVVVLVLTVMVTSFVNWGCGLVVAGLLAREIAKRIRIDFGWLVAAATGLAEVISKSFVAFSNGHTLPFWNFVASQV